MTNTVQNLWQGSNFFTNQGNQFWGQFNGVFTGTVNGSVTGGPTLAGTQTWTGVNTFSNASNSFLGTFGTSGTPASFYGTGTFGYSGHAGTFYGIFTGSGASAFVGDGTALTGVGLLGASGQIWTGTNAFNPGPLQSGDGVATDLAFTGQGYIQALGAIYATTFFLAGTVSTPNTNVGVYSYGYIQSAGNIYCGSSSTFVGSPSGLTGFKAGVVTFDGVSTSYTVTFNTNEANTNYIVLVEIGLGALAGYYYVSAQRTNGFDVTVTSPTSPGVMWWLVWPFNNP